jgi:hypothetical protein
MADLNHPQSTQQWQQDDSEELLDLDMDDDDELFFDDDEIAEDIIALSEDIPSWRRIEMAREDRFLKEAMADFEDYDDFEDLGHGYAAEFSH